MAALNQSKVKMWRRCQKQFAFRYDYAPAGQELIPKQKKLPLYRGSWMHALQEALHYQWAGFSEFEIHFGEGSTRILIPATSWEDVHEALSKQFRKLFEEERDELGELDEDCERLFRSYLRFWNEDQETYSVAVYQGKPMIEFGLEAKISGVDDPFKGRIDLVVEDDEYEGLWVWDAKWVKRIPPPDERMMSPQALLYVLALRRKYKLDIRGFVYNYGRTKPPTIPKVLKRPAGMLSMAQKMDTDLYTYYRAIKDAHGKDYKKFLDYYRPKLQALKGREAMWFDRQRIPTEERRIEQALSEFRISGQQIAKRVDHEVAPRSYFYNCRFSCDYHELCVAEFQGLNVEPLIKHNYEYVDERYAPKEEDLLNA